jgi:high affinity Mn2+ porin
MPKYISAAAMLVCAMGLTAPALADDANDSWLPDTVSLHAQSTFIYQYHPAFASPYRGTNSLAPQNVGDETWDVTLFAGARLWDGGAVFVNPELDQGFGFSDTVGVAGFPSGEAYKIGDTSPYLKWQRAFFRQTFNLGGDTKHIDADANQFDEDRTADNIVLTLGKFSVGDVFDTNQYAHDPRGDFLNWSLIDAGAFDYAADSWGYASGAAGEWTEDWWTLRGGLFNLSKIPNGKDLESTFGEFEAIIETEERHTLFGHDGKVKLLAFLNRGRMGGYQDAIALGDATHTTPNTALVRRYASRPGGEINIEQGLTDNLGAFLRLSANDGSKEAYEFTEINRSVSGGLSLKGADWNRPSDAVGLAGVVNNISKDARDYLAAGGIGILIGDGRLPRYESEDILEAYYSAQITDWLTTSVDYQFIDNPAYNPQRGPVSSFALRLHVQF